MPPPLQAERLAAQAKAALQRHRADLERADAEADAARKALAAVKASKGKSPAKSRDSDMHSERLSSKLPQHRRFLSLRSLGPADGTSRLFGACES